MVLVSQIISGDVYSFICLLSCVYIFGEKSTQVLCPFLSSHWFQMSLLLLNQYILILAILTYSEQYEQEIKSPPTR